jgi:alkylhydroperoxidase family enzyme
MIDSLAAFATVAGAVSDSETRSSGGVVARVDPLDPPYETDVEQQLQRMMPPGVAPIALFRLFAKNLPMASAMESWGSYELNRALTLSMRDREIVIDRTCARAGCEYEWGVHVRFYADRVGFTPEQVTSLAHGDADDVCWEGERERLLIEAVDALHDTSDIPDDLWAGLSRVFDERQLIDLLLLSGWYHAISFVARATRLPLEPGAPTFASVAGSLP